MTSEPYSSEISSERSVVIETDLPVEAVAGFSSFFERYYIATNRPFIEQDSYRKAESESTFTFSWKLKVHENNQEVFLYCRLKVSQPSIELSFRDLDNVNQLQIALSERTIDDVQNIASSYLLNTKMSSLYFVIGGGEEKQSEAPTQEGSTQRSVLKRIFSGSSTNVFLVFMLLSFILFFTIGFYALFLLIAFQFLYLVYSDRIILNMGYVRPTSEKPLVSIVSVRSNPETLKFLRLHGKKILAEIRDDVSKLHVAVSVDKSTVSRSDQEVKSAILSILSRYGIAASVNDVEIKTRNVYEIVKKVAERFNQAVPKVVIVNSVVSNASATGISAKHSSIMITAGSLEDLTDEELESIIGHELSHVKGHDPTILFALTSFQFIGMFYLWYPLVLFLGLFYFVLAFWVIYAVGKILETRADTESAIVLGNPSALASSLRKIGFRELYHEKYTPLLKLLDWFRFDPHPPIYFRIIRMSEFVGSGKKIKHAFFISLRDCITGFFSALV
jgi:heat shock protein HtpX